MPKMKRIPSGRAALALGAWVAYVLAFIPLYRPGSANGAGRELAGIGLCHPQPGHGLYPYLAGSVVLVVTVIMLRRGALDTRVVEELLLCAQKGKDVDNVLE